MKHPVLNISTRHRAHFKTLGISPTNDFSVIRTAFKAKALASHPDNTHDHDRTVFLEAKQALEELEFLEEFPILTGSLQEQTDEEKEEEEARETLAREEEERTGNRMENKKSQEGSYAWVVGDSKHAIDVDVEKEEKSEKKTSGMAFVMKRKHLVAEKQHEHERKTEAPEPKHQQESPTQKKKQFPTTKDKLNKVRARTNINPAASNAHKLTKGGRHTYNDFFELFGDANWDLGEEDHERDDEHEEMKEQRRRGKNW